jgi:hypothetical protein
MGQILKATCATCNFENEFRFGGGRLDNHTNKPVPAINVTTGNMESVNYFEFKDSFQYVFYSNALLKRMHDPGNTFRNFDLTINAKNNFCPNCKEFTLIFACTLFYD